MAGTRTAPLWTAAATSRLVTLHLIDASGDLATVPLIVPVATTAADLEAYADDYALSSQSSLYKITDMAIREGDADPDNAEADFRGTVADGINLLFKNITTHQAQQVRVVAPIDAILQGNQDIPLISAAPLVTLIPEILVLLGASYDFRQAQYTERRERKNNPRIK